ERGRRHPALDADRGAEIRTLVTPPPEDVEARIGERGSHARPRVGEHVPALDRVVAAGEEHETRLGLVLASEEALVDDGRDEDEAFGLLRKVPGPVRVDADDHVSALERDARKPLAQVGADYAADAVVVGDRVLAHVSPRREHARNAVDAGGRDASREEVLPV